MIFFGSGSGSYFLVGFGSDINYFLFSYVRFLIMTRYKLFREIFFDKKDFFKTDNLFWEIVKFYQFLREFILQIPFGSEAARIRNDFSRILVKVSDLTRSGSTHCLTTLSIENKISFFSFSFLIWRLPLYAIVDFRPFLALAKGNFPSRN
jgi:hypothetical protein